MDFLVNALYSETDAESTPEHFVGAVVTNFDLSDYCKRPSNRFVTAAMIREPSCGFVPVGFCLHEDGVFMSDTQARSTLNPRMMNYIQSELSAPRESAPGLIDLVLFLAHSGGYVVPNYEEAKSGSEDLNIVSAKTFKVSESSFNIYAPYRKANGEFRTFSLVNIENNEAVPFYVALPRDIVISERLLPLLSKVDSVGDTDTFEFYLASAILNGSDVFLGEAFCNYLAYHVAYYKMGLKVLEWAAPQPKTAESTTDSADYNRKTPAPSMTISCSYKKVYPEVILDMVNNKQFSELNMLISSDEEAYISYQWVSRMISTAQSIGGTEWDKQLHAACLNLRAEARADLLRVSLELLAQRLHIFKKGPVADPIATSYLKGGGVNGVSVKKFIG